MDRIGIVGAGHVGAALARRLVAKGHKVKVANSRGRQSLVAFARDTGARPADLGDVASDVDILILAIPLGRIRALPPTMIDALRPDGVVIDTGNYVPPRDGAIDDIDAGLPETAWVSRQLGFPVVKAFNNLTDHGLEHQGRPAGARGRIAVPVSGDDAAKRAAAMRLVNRLGFDAYDAGPLAESWRQQIGQPAFATHPNPRELPVLLARADAGKLRANRDQSMTLMAKMPEAFPKPDLVRVARLMVGLDRLKPATWLATLRLGVAMLTHKG